jgi:hypothetical protein
MVKQRLENHFGFWSNKILEAIATSIPDDKSRESPKWKLIPYSCSLLSKKT